MKRMASFEKVSYQQFKKDWLDTFTELNDIDDTEALDKHIREIYDNIKLPRRATAYSAGYDVFSPVSFTLEPGESIKIPTGIRCEMYDSWVMLGFPRSGHGFKYGIRHLNTIPVIDSDYFEADNEGHIAFKIVNDSSLAKTFKLNAGDAFCQVIFLPFGITLDDAADGERHGGFGSTDKN